MMRRFFYIRDFLIQKNISIYTKVIKLLKIEIEKLTSNFSFSPQEMDQFEYTLG